MIVKVRFLEEKLHSGLTTIEVAVQSVQDDYELPVRLIQAPNWPTSLPALNNTMSLVSLVQEMTTNYQNGPLVVVDKYVLAEFRFIIFFIDLLA